MLFFALAAAIIGVCSATCTDTLGWVDHDGLGCSQPDLAAARLRGVRGQLIGVQGRRQVGALGEGAPRRARLHGRQALRLGLGLGLGLA